MAQTVSNDALWEKLSEMDRKIDGMSAIQKSLPAASEQPGNSPDFMAAKEEIIAEIKGYIHLLGLSSDSHFKVHRENIELLDRNMRKVWNIVARIRKQQKESAERQAESDGEQQQGLLEVQAKENRGYLDFLFFKVRKTSIAIAALGLLVFILTLFCMKQHNDYSLLNREFHQQNTTIQELDGALKTPEEQNNKKQPKK